VRFGPRRKDVLAHSPQVEEGQLAHPDGLLGVRQERAPIAIHAVELRADQTRHSLGEVHLVERVVVGERDRERLDRPAREPRHGRRHDGRIDPAAQVHAERYVCPQTQPDRLLHLRPDERSGLLEVTSARPGLPQIHVPIPDHLVVPCARSIRSMQPGGDDPTPSKSESGGTRLR
jgi:hypothetical protein